MLLRLCLRTSFRTFSGANAAAVVANAPSGDRFAAELGIAPSGRIDVAFYDRSYTANTMVDLTYATSSDGGAIWRSARVSKSSFDPSLYGVPSGAGIRPFIGDYNGVFPWETGYDVDYRPRQRELYLPFFGPADDD